MPKKLILFYTCFLCSMFAQAQLTVKLMDEVGEPVPYANTQLISKAVGENLYLGAASDTNGIASYSGLKPDEYFMVIMYLGYKKDTINHIAISKVGEQKDLGIHILQPEDYRIDEVVIEGTRPTISYEDNGNLIYKPGTTTLGQNEDAENLLQSIPGVGLNSQKGYMINGNTNIVVLVDGRRLSGDKETMMSYLETINAQEITSVEVIKSAVAKYDGAASGGAINIITKKGSFAGVNGFLYARYRQGQLPSFKARANLNWKRKNLSGTAFYETRYWQDFHNVDITRSIEQDRTKLFYNEDIYESWVYARHVGRFFLNYDINKNNRLGFLFELRHVTIDQPIASNSMPSSTGNNPDSLIISAIQKNDTEVWPAANINYAFDPNGRGNNIIAVYDFFYKDISKLSSYNEQTFEPIQNDLIGSNRFNRNNLFLQPVHTVSLDYSRELKREVTIDLGTKYIHIQKESSSQFKRSISGAFIEQPEFGREFEYTEKIYAGYVNINKKFSGWNFNAGLRIEKSIIDQLFISDALYVERNNLNFFPTISFYKKLDKEIDFRVNFSRGLTRPRFIELDPIRIELGPFLISEGNPNLRPQTDNVIGFEFIFKNKYTLFANYNLSNRSINTLFDEESQGVYNITYANFDQSHFFNAGGNVGTELNAWWTLSADLNFYFDKYNIEIDTEKVTTNGASMSVSLISQFTIPKGFLLDLVANYESPRYYALERFKSTGYFNLSLTKTFFNDKMTIKAGVLDLFRTRRIETVQSYEGLDATYLELNDSRRFELLVNYRFRKGDNFRAKRNNRSNDDVRYR